MVLTPEGSLKLHRTGTHTSSMPVGSKSRAADAVCYRTPCPGSTVPRGNPLPSSELGQQQAWYPSYGQANIAADAASIVILYMPKAPRPLPPLRPSIMPTTITITAPTSTTPTNQGCSSRRRHHHRCYGRLPTTPMKKKKKNSSTSLGTCQIITNGRLRHNSNSNNIFPAMPLPTPLRLVSEYLNVP